MKALKSRFAAMVVASVVTATVVGTVAWAQIPSTEGTITACYNKGGPLSVIDAPAERCGKNQKQLQWNAGPSGISGYEIVTDVLTQPAETTSFFTSRSATCPAGKAVLGGGASVELESGIISSGFRVIQSGPVDDTAWRATYSVANPFDETIIATVYAICANVS